METLTFAGSYEDDRGREDIIWRIEGSRRYRISSLEYFTSIRGVDVWGRDFDGLEPVAGSAAAGVLPLNAADELTECVITCDLPCTTMVADKRQPTTITFSLDLHLSSQKTGGVGALRLSLVLAGVTYAVTDDWFEDGVQRLEKSLPSGVRLTCCVTCLSSDYSPGGHGLTGISCHRGAKEQYLAVKSKRDYWKVPVAEEVPETYVCGEYERRIPGTGYRG